MSKTASHTNKDVIYVDIDDEITAIIDKIRSSRHRIIALVLPKRASMMQSIVNMKLIKRCAEESKKHVVLITSESSLLPLAGSVGLYVAKTLQSRPEIPPAPANMSAKSAAYDDSDADLDEDEPKLDKRLPIGAYADASASSYAADDEDAIELDNTTSDESDASGAKAARGLQSKKDKKIKIPDFNKFRLALILGGVGVVLLGVGMVYAFVVAPKATISIKTDSSAIQINTDITLDTAAETVDVDEAITPATLQKVQKTKIQEVETTGKLDKGQKATGTMRFYNCNEFDTLAGNDRIIPAGTGVSAGGLTFITTKTVTVEPSHFNGNTCKKDKMSSPVSVVAQAPGEKYNVSATSYKVAGFDTITGEGSAMTGGTSEIVRVVAQADIENARQKIAAQDTGDVKLELKKSLQAKGLYPLVDTFTAVSNPEETISVPVGSQADTVVVTQKITYTMLGAKKSDLEKLVAHEVYKEIDKDKQNILDYGLDNAAFKMQNNQGTASMVTMELVSIAGSDLDLNEIKAQVAGKKASDAKDIIGSYPGVTDVTVKYSPFWVRSIPKKASKITVTVEKPQVKNAQQ